MTSTYSFNFDYVSHFTRLWAEYLKHLRGRAGVRMLEIGALEGRSAIWFLENILTGPGSTITCIDVFWGPHGEAFDRNMVICGKKDQLIKLTGRSQEILPTLAPANFDAIYIDGGHHEHEVWEDASESWRLARPGAVIVLDDYLWELQRPPEERPMRAIDRFLAEHRGDYELKYKGYQVIVQKLN
jgi:predicted O-methyltransferase YrrM